MKNLGIIIFVLALSFSLTGCNKKQPPVEQGFQEPVSMEALSAMGTEQSAAPEVKAMEGKAPGIKTEVIKPEVSIPVEPKLEPLPPSGPYKPTANEIQTALKNAGYYNGKVDGKAGPMTKKAIEEFQKANSLTADGKVGPKTWALLSKSLNVEPAKEAAPPAKR